MKKRLKQAFIIALVTSALLLLVFFKLKAYVDNGSGAITGFQTGATSLPVNNAWGYYPLGGAWGFGF